ncbi:hypothetical protein E4198_08705 [Streptomyces sp. RKND-216]|uniref:hypothetical protein n=1 Tax=Streptomyces sp. RKND-216 TaxID=2562581 RepID=UPI00109DDE00|nr:hypothetical protein [Streptomyces sp. RKND-216]THA24807.1 hypothetical protein E4198_08705 [Streptomyces sp. RKND-216]
MTLQHPAQRGGGERGVFEWFSARVSNVTSSPLFFAACILMIAGVVMSTSRGAGALADSKLDAIAEAMLEHYEGEGNTAGEDLRRAIRLERER